MTMLIPMMAAMYLGGSFNMKSYERGTQTIFSESTLQDAKKIIDRSMTRSYYRLIENAADVRDFLNVDGELSLKIKSGVVPPFKGIGEYLKEQANKEKYVELLVKVEHETITETIPSWVHPDPGWNDDKEPDAIGTHFIRSVTYGGLLLASVRFDAKDDVDREKIKAAMNANIKFGGSFNISAKGNFDRLLEELKGISTMDIKIKAPIDPQNPVHTIDDLMKLVEAYPKEVAKFNNGSGPAIRAEIYPLASLDANFPLYLRNNALRAVVNDLEEKFDDVQLTKKAFDKWLEQRGEDEDEVLRKIYEMKERLKKTASAFRRAIQSMDTSMEGVVEQFDGAATLYGTGKENLPHHFERMLYNLRRELGEKLQWKRSVGGGTSYIHWGKDSCPSSESRLVYSGLVAGSPGFGSGTNLQCMPKDVNLVPYEGAAKEKAGKLAALGNLDCAMCEMPRASTLLVFPARSTCPSGWEMVYKGLLSAEVSGNTGHQFLCLESGIQTDKFGTVFGSIGDVDKGIVCVVCSH